MFRLCFILLLFCITAAGAGLSAVLPNADSTGRIVQTLLRSGGYFDDQSRPLRTKQAHDSALIKHELDQAARCESDQADSSLYFATKAFALSVKAKWLKTTSLSLQYFGDYAMAKENHATAIKYFLLAASIEEKRNDLSRLGQLMDEIGLVYTSQEIYPKAAEYFAKASEIFTARHDSALLAMLYSHKGNLEFSRQYCEKRSPVQIRSDMDKAIGLYQKSVDLCTALGNESRAVHGRLNIASAYNQSGHPEKALPLLRQALDYYSKNNNQSLMGTTYFSMGIALGKLKQLDQSIRCYKESLRLAKLTGNTGGTEYVYEQIAQTYKESGDYKNALEAYLTYINLRDSVFSKEKSQQIFELETRYDKAKKQEQIEKLTYQKNTKNILLASLLFLLVAVGIIAAILTKNLKNRKKIAEQTLIIRDQKIADLEKEHQLIAAKAVLEGEETERHRMAHDLHDGLGGLLSGIKINLWNMKENAVISSDNITAFNQALGLLDHSIQELRRIAHNLMPETLMHYGVRTALHDFFAQLPQQGGIINFQSYGNDSRYPHDIELAAYRVTQELINNALKYAGSSQITVQLFQEPNRLCIQVSDNGTGFDTSGLQYNTEGKGLQGIRNRVAMLGGKFEISSSKSEGTEAMMEFCLI